MRLVIAFVAILIAAPVWAGDLATYRSIGHSPDGRHFAFMQYGVTDGAGAPYVDAFLIDTQTDGFVSGTPVRLGGGEPGDLSESAVRARLAGLRAEAETLVADALVAAGGTPDWREGDTLAHSPSTHLSGDPLTMTVNPFHLTTPGPAGALTATLSPIDFAPTTNGCPDSGGPFAASASPSRMAT